MSNKIAIPETKDIVYGPVYRHFTEFDTETGESVTGVFLFDDAIEGRLIRQDKYTILVLSDGSRGVAECASDDEFSRRDGLKVAYARAMVEHFQKVIEQSKEID